jgi:hypothetical protein
LNIWRNDATGGEKYHLSLLTGVRQIAGGKSRGNERWGHEFFDFEG